MREISIFDVIGPNMIGPSSSHTAGALRIARLVRKLINKPVAEVTFTLYGSFAKTYKGHGTDRALVAGMLGMETEDERIKDAFTYAAKEGLQYHFETCEELNDMHPNTVETTVRAKDGEMMRVVASSIGGGSIAVNKIDGMEVELTGEYFTILVKQQDTPGMIAHITKCLSSYDINIAFMRLYREEKGTIAYTIIEADEKIDERVAERIKAQPGILEVKMIEGI